MDENPSQKTKYFCPFCKEYIEKKWFEEHKIFHRNDANCWNHPESLAEMKQRFEMIGLYDEV